MPSLEKVHVAHTPTIYNKAAPTKATATLIPKKPAPEPNLAAAPLVATSNLDGLAEPEAEAAAVPLMLVGARMVVTLVTAPLPLTTATLVLFPAGKGAVLAIALEAGRGMTVCTTVAVMGVGVGFEEPDGAEAAAALLTGEELAGDAGLLDAEPAAAATGQTVVYRA